MDVEKNADNDDNKEVDKRFEYCPKCDIMWPHDVVSLINTHYIAASVL